MPASRALLTLQSPWFYRMFFGRFKAPLLEVPFSFPSDTAEKVVEYLSTRKITTLRRCSSEQLADLLNFSRMARTPLSECDAIDGIYTRTFQEANRRAQQLSSLREFETAYYLLNMNWSDSEAIKHLRPAYLKFLAAEKPDIRVKAYLPGPVVNYATRWRYARSEMARLLLPHCLTGLAVDYADLDALREDYEHGPNDWQHITSLTLVGKELRYDADKLDAMLGAVSKRFPHVRILTWATPKTSLNQRLGQVFGSVHAVLRKHRQFTLFVLPAPKNRTVQLDREGVNAWDAVQGSYCFAAEKVKLIIRAKSRAFRSETWECFPVDLLEGDGGDRRTLRSPFVEKKG